MTVFGMEERHAGQLSHSEWLSEATPSVYCRAYMCACMECMESRKDISAWNQVEIPVLSDGNHQLSNKDLLLVYKGHFPVFFFLMQVHLHILIKIQGNKLAYRYSLFKGHNLEYPG